MWLKDVRDCEVYAKLHSNAKIHYINKKIYAIYHILRISREGDFIHVFNQNQSVKGAEVSICVIGDAKGGHTKSILQLE